MASTLIRPHLRMNYKTESLKDKYKVNDNAYNDWLANPYLSITEICKRHEMSANKLRAWIKTYNKPRPDAERLKTKREERQYWIMKAYERGLRYDLHAQKMASWANEKCNNKYLIERIDIQNYARKHNLPYLKESAFLSKDNMRKESKYG